MKNEEFNKFYDFDKSLEFAIFNIVGFQFCNIPRNINTTICGNKLTDRSSVTLEVLSKKPKLIYKKDVNIYWAFDEKYQVFNSYSDTKNHFTDKGFFINIDCYGGKVFNKKGITRDKKVFVYNTDSHLVAKEKLGIKIINIGFRKRNESFAYQTNFLVNIEVVERKLLQCGLNILDFDNSLFDGEC